MRIGGYQPFTLSDYPGLPAAIVFTQGCNMACPFCHNHELIDCQRAASLEEAQVLQRIASRRHVLQGVVITGGEPTLQHDLPAFCRKLQEMGLRVKLDTNGSHPAMLEDLIAQKLVNYIAMDVKAPLDEAARHATVTGSRLSTERVRQSMWLIADSGVAHHFRTTAVFPLLDEAALRKIESQIPPGSKHVRQTFRPELAWDESLRQAAKAHTAAQSPTPRQTALTREGATLG